MGYGVVVPLIAKNGKATSFSAARKLQEELSQCKEDLCNTNDQHERQKVQLESQQPQICRYEKRFERHNKSFKENQEALEKKMEEFLA